MAKMDDAEKAYKTTYWWAYMNAEECGLTSPELTLHEVKKLAGSAVMAAVIALRGKESEHEG